MNYDWLPKVIDPDPEYQCPSGTMNCSRLSNEEMVSHLLPSVKAMIKSGGRKDIKEIEVVGIGPHEEIVFKDTVPNNKSIDVEKEVTKKIVTQMENALIKGFSIEMKKTNGEKKKEF